MPIDSGVDLTSWALWVIFANGQEDAIARQRAAVEQQARSIGLQQASVRRQSGQAPAAAPSFFVTLEDPKPVSKVTCEPLSPVRVRALVETESKRAGIGADLLEAVMRQESGFRPCSVSDKGAMGLMQLMPATAQDFGVQDPFDPDRNVAAGASLLKQLIDRYGGDLNRALGAYNAGAVKVDAAGGVPAIPETMHYVEAIMGRLNNN